MEDVPPDLISRLMSVRSKQDLMQLLAQHPELTPVLEQMMQQATGPGSPAPAQTQADAEFMAELAQTPPEVLQIVHQLSQPVRDPREYDSRVQLCQRGLRLVKREHSPLLWAAFQFFLGNAFGQTPAGSRVENLESAIAWMWRQIGDDQKALEYFGRCLPLEEKLPDKGGLVRTLYELGYIYGEQGDFSKAREYYERSAALAFEIGNERALGFVKAMLGRVAESYGQISEARQLWIEAESILRKFRAREADIVSGWLEAEGFAK